MPSANLLQTLNRLDRAISRAEAAGDALIRKAARSDNDRKALIQNALEEIDSLIDSLQPASPASTSA